MKKIEHGEQEVILNQMVKKLEDEGLVIYEYGAGYPNNSPLIQMDHGIWVVYLNNTWNIRVDFDKNFYPYSDSNEMIKKIKELMQKDYDEAMAELNKKE